MLRYTRIYLHTRVRGILMAASTKFSSITHTSARTHAHNIHVRFDKEAAEVGTAEKRNYRLGNRTRESADDIKRIIILYGRTSTTDAADVSAPDNRVVFSRIDDSNTNIINAPRRRTGPAVCDRAITLYYVIDPAEKYPRYRVIPSLV